MPAAAAELIRRQHITHTTTELGRLLGVSGPTVRVWARALGVRCLDPRKRPHRRGTVHIAEHLARVSWVFGVSEAASAWPDPQR